MSDIPGQSSGQSSGQPSDLNPYAAATPSSPSMSESPIDMRPNGLTVMGVLCVLGGIMGLLMSLIAVAQLLFAPQFAFAMTPGGAGPSPQSEMMKAMEALTNKFIIPNVGVGFCGLVLSSCMLIGGIAIFRRKAWVPTWLRRTFVALIAFEIVRQVLYAFMQVEMYPIMQRYFAQMANGPGGPGGPGGQAMMESMHTVSIVVGLVFAGGWALLKLALYVWGTRYLGKPQIQSYFAAKE